MTDTPQLPENFLHDMTQTGAVGGVSIEPTFAAMNGENHSRRGVPILLHQQQEESVLGDILEELDRERHRRAELEAKVRVLEQELHSERRKNRKSSFKTTSVKDYTRMQAERDGYREIVEALTQDRPAFSTSLSAESDNNNNNKRNDKHKKRDDNGPHLPLHIVRLLEVMPWDARAQSYVFGHEQVWEWQMMGADKKWKKELHHFPTFFKSLPIVMPANGKTIQTEVRAGGFGGVGTVTPPKRCVLTNLDATQLLNIDKGYPLPEDGGDWTWVGNWKVEKTNDTDEQGWSYSNDYQIMAASTYYHEFRVPEKGKPAVPKRRRKWMRRRILIDYPFASQMTREYLKLLAEKATLDVAADKLSSQLVETKMGLTTIEAERFSYQEQTNSRLRELELDLQEKNRILGLVENGAGLKLTGNGEKHISNPASESKKTDQVAEIGKAVSQWVSSTVHKRQGSHDATTENENDGKADHTTREVPTSREQSSSHLLDPKQQLFDSIRGKGTDLFEKLKHNAGQEIDKIKHGLGGNNSTHDKKNRSDSDDNGTSSNVYVPATKVKMQNSSSM